MTVRRRVLAGVVTMLLSASTLVGFVAPVPAAAYPTTTVPLAGHGWGHGRGLGQWGAYGYATNGAFFWNWQQIVQHFYSNATLSNQPDAQIGVRLMALEGSDLVVQAGAGGMNVGGVVLGQGDAARVTTENGGFRLWTRHGCGDVDGWTTVISDPIAVPLDGNPGTDVTKMLSLCGATATTQYRGALRLVGDVSGLHTVNLVGMEDYLRGVVPRESPASWGDAVGGHGINALYAQAVAARSYAWGENRYAYAKTCDTTSCQVYSGAGQNFTRIEDSRTDRAIVDTNGFVMRMGDNSIARTEFSSSTGGYTAGGTFPAVPDDGDIASPYHDWTASLQTSSIESTYAVGTLTSIAVTARNGLGADGGRVTTVKISGTSGSTTVTGSTFQSQWGLRTNWFSFTGQPQATLPWFTRNTADPGGATGAFLFGVPGDRPISCDWFKQGFDTPGVFRRGLWSLSASSDGSTVDAVFRFGDPGDVPLCGDWDGDGFDTVAVWRGGTFFLNNQNDGSAPDGVFRFGNPTDVPVAGNWNPDPWDSVGVDRNGTFFLANSNLGPSANIVFSYGDPGDVPVVGDWNGDALDTIGVRRSNKFLLSDNPPSGVANRIILFGNPTDLPVTGAWSGGATGIGVTR